MWETWTWHKEQSKGKCTPLSRTEHGRGGAAQHTGLCLPSAASSPRACTACVTFSTATTGCSLLCWPHSSRGAEKGLWMDIVPEGPQVSLQGEESASAATVQEWSQAWHKVALSLTLERMQYFGKSLLLPLCPESTDSWLHNTVLNLNFGKQAFLGLALSKDSGACMWWAWSAFLTGLLGYIQPLEYGCWMSSCGAIPKKYVARCNSYYYLNDYC